MARRRTGLDLSSIRDLLDEDDDDGLVAPEIDTEEDGEEEGQNIVSVVEHTFVGDVEINRQVLIPSPAPRYVFSVSVWDFSPKSCEVIFPPSRLGLCRPAPGQLIVTLLFFSF